MVAIALCSASCRPEGWADVERVGTLKQRWFAKFIELPNGCPSHDTFVRVFGMRDTAEFYRCLKKCLGSLNHALKDRGVQLDGKTARHGFRGTATSLRSMLVG